MSKHRLKRQIGAGSIEAALRNRLQDMTSSRQEIEARTALLRPTSTDLIAEPGQLLSAQNETRRHQDIGLAIELQNRGLEALENHMVHSWRDTDAVVAQLNALSRSGLDSLQQHVIKTRQSYDHVDVNSFQSRMDLRRNAKIKIDPKSGDGVPASRRVYASKNLGVTQPVVQKTRLNLAAVRLVGDESSLGFGLQVDDPSVLLNERGIYNHAVALQERNSNNRSFSVRKQSATLCLEFDLGAMEVVNGVTIDSASQRTLTLESVRYWDGAAWQDVGVSGKIKDVADLRFSHVRARQLRVLFSTKPVERGTFYRYDEELDEIIAGYGLTQRYGDLTRESFDGVAFDFALESVQFYRYIYDSVGVYEGPPLRYDALGVTIDSVTSGSGSLDRYVLVYGPDNQEYMLPVPDAGGSTTEQLFPVGGTCRVKLFPDLTQSMTRWRVTGSTSGTFQLTLTTALAHNLTVGDYVSFSNISDLPDSYQVASVGTNSVTINVSTAALAAVTIDSSETPAVWMWSTTQPDPVTVTEDGVAITLGTDWEYSIDGGATYLSEWHRDDIDNRNAGHFLIRLGSADLGKKYAVTYDVASRQTLADVAELRSSVIEIEGLETTEVRPVFFLRGSSATPYETLTLTKYWVKGTEAK